MRAGKLDRSVTLQVVTRTVDASGGPTESWATLASVRAQRLPRAGSEAFSADQLSSVADVLYRIRWRSDVGTANNRLVDTDTYDIVAMDEEGRRRGLLLYCKMRRTA